MRERSEPQTDLLHTTQKKKKKVQGLYLFVVNSSYTCHYLIILLNQ